MKALNIFLEALNSRLDNKRGFFVPKITTLDCKFPAYKKLEVEVWCIDGAYKNCISSVSIADKYTTKDEKENLEVKVIKETIKNVLKYYGI